MVGDPFTTQRGDGDPLPPLLAAVGFAQAEEIGRGGFGVVYRALQVELDRVVAVKVLTGELEDNRPRFLREQRAMARLTGHPNIASVLQVGQTANGHPFLVMPYYGGDCLQARIKLNGLLPLEEVLHVGVKIAGALASAHRLQIVHRDVKPANILLTDYGEPALTDFGIAHVTGGFKTATGFVSGSPAYTAPEVLAGGTATEASDVYGLGATLFTALTGHAAFERRQGEQVVAQFVRITSEPLPDFRKYNMPTDVASLVAQAMTREPSTRPTALQLGERLQQLQAAHHLSVDEMVIQDSGAFRAARQLAATPPAPPAARLPDSTTLVGHEADLSHLRQLLTGSPLVTVSGISGTGKTALAALAAAQSAGDFPDGTWWAELSQLNDGSLLPHVVAVSLDVPEQSGRAITDVVVNFLKPRQGLLILDGCDRIVDDAAKLIETLLRDCPRLHILTTSTEPLDLTGEAVLNLTHLGPYRLEQPIGHSTTGQVYRATDTKTQRIVALKVLPHHLTNDPAFRQRFHHTSQALADLNQPHIAAIHTFGEINGRLYLDMALIEGRSLKSILAQTNTPLEPAVAVTIVEQAAAALDAAHAAKVIHGDITPSTLLVTDTNSVSIIDFGLTPTPAPPSTDTPDATAYCAPERFDGNDADARSDTYSLACVLYQCLTGAPPYAAKSSRQQIAGHMVSPVPRPSATNPNLAPFDPVITRALAKKPADRYPNATQLAAAARQALSSPTPTNDHTPQHSTPHRTRPTRRRIIAIAATALLLITLATFATLQWRNHPPTNDPTPNPTTPAQPDQGPVPQIAATLPADIKAAGTLIIGVTTPYAPIEFRNADGQIVGFDVDLMNAVTRTLGLKPEYRDVPFEGIIPAVQRGEFDAGMSSFTDTLKREKLVDFVTYFEAGILWAQRPGSPVDPNAACGLKVGVAEGGIQETDEIPAKSAVCTAAGLKPIVKTVYPNQDETTAALIAGEVDAMSADSPVTGFAIKLSSGALKPAGEVFDTAPYGWPVAKGSSLSESLRLALEHIMATGEYHTIATKWGVENGMIDKPVINGAHS